MSRDRLLDIGAVIDASGVPASTLHVWERAGLIAPACRSGLRRQYHPDVLERISLIVLSKRAGFSLPETSALLTAGAFADGKVMLKTKLEELCRKRAELDVAIATLEHAIACPAPSPIECEHFRAIVPTVLPVDRTPRGASSA